MRKRLAGEILSPAKGSFRDFPNPAATNACQMPYAKLKPEAGFATKRHDALPQENQSAMSEKRTDQFKLSERKRVFEMGC